MILVGPSRTLNCPMESILGSLETAVIVLDHDLVVQVWTPRAHELWGLRADETIGQHLLNLDSGLPTAELHPWLLTVITGQQTTIIRRVDAVNRRGRSVQLRVTVSALQTDSAEPAGALILIEDFSGIASADDALNVERPVN